MSIVELDQSVTLWLNNLGTEALDPFWTFLSNAKVWFPFYAVVMGFLIWRLGWKKGLIAVAALFLTVFLTDQLSGLIKDSVQRLRPCYDPWMIDHGVHSALKPHSQFGFFSSHAANTFGFAILSLLCFKMDKKHTYHIYGWCVIIWATLVSLSRIMLAAHYVGDIVAGAIFGLAVGTAIAKICQALRV